MAVFVVTFTDACEIGSRVSIGSRLVGEDIDESDRNDIDGVIVAEFAQRFLIVALSLRR